MRKWTVPILALFLPLFAFSCGGGGSSDPDGDQDAGGEATETEPAAFGEACSNNNGCISGICYPGTSGNFCSMSCSTDMDCENVVLGSCCYPEAALKVCLLPEQCIVSDGDGESADGDDAPPDGDNSLECAPETYRCMNNAVEQCSSNGTAWLWREDCTGDSVCRDGACRNDGVDGDTDSATDGDGEGGCGDPGQMPGTLIRYATDMFNLLDSNPSLHTEIVTSQNPDFGSAKDYVRLNADASGEYLALDLDIDTTYLYIIELKYVCGIDWGEVSLHLDNPDSQPIKHLRTDQPNNRLNLNCNPVDSSTPPRPQDEMYTDKVTYETLCIEEGEHTLYLKVYGKDQNSGGYDIGAWRVYASPFRPE